MTIVSGNSPEATGQYKQSPRKPGLAVIKVEVILGNSHASGDFERAVFYGQSLASSTPVSGIELTGAELGQLQLEGASAERLSPENKLLLKAIAMAQAGQDHYPSGRGALFFTRASELVFAAGQRFFPNETNPSYNSNELIQFQACVSPRFNKLVDLSLEGSPLASGLAAAQKLLDSGEIEFVILAGAAVHTPDLDKLIAKAGIRLSSSPINLGFDRDVDGWTFGEGAVAVVVMNAEAARIEKHPIYAVIEGVGFSSKDLANPKKHIIPTFVSSDTIFQSCQQAFAQSGCSSEKIGYLEALASGFSPLDTAEIGGLTRAYALPEADFRCALGSVQLQSGFLPSLAGIAGLARASLCLYNRYIPAVPGWSGPKKPDLFENTPFYVPNDPRTWFLTASEQRRSAAVNAIGWDGSCVHVILSEDTTCQKRPNQFLVEPPVSLFPLAGDSLEELISNLTALNNSLDDTSLYAAALSCYKSYQVRQDSPFGVCLVAHDFLELRKEISSAIKGIPGAFEKRTPWQTLAGSFFTPEPVGPEAGIAFVYPGAFNSYVGLGRDLFTLFPSIYEWTTRLTSDIAATIQDRQIFPRSLETLTKDQVQKVETQLNADPIAMITSGSLISVLFTMILQDIFKIHPAAACGYSLGEIGMLFASGIWDQADAVRASLLASPLFPERLSGPQSAIREHWQLPKDPGNDPIWANYFLMSGVEPVKNALKNHQRVYLTHINTPRQVVIGGDPQECQQVISELKCTSLRAPFDFALHCEAMSAEYSRLAELLTWPVAAQSQSRLYTAAGFEPLVLESGRIADRISSMLCSSLDFPNLVRKTYVDGARIFIELGANANCTKWIEEILKGQAFTAVAVNRKGVDDLTSIVRMLAKLVSNRVRLDLNPLYNSKEESL